MIRFFKSPFPSVSGERLIGVSNDCIAFGHEVSPSMTQWVHFRREDWPTIKKYIDEQLKKQPRMDK